MHPILFEIPGLGFPIRSFGVLVASGIFLGIWLWGKILERHGNDPAEDPLRASQVAVWIVVGILVGARAMYVVVESARYLSADVTEEMERYLSAENRSAMAAQMTLASPDAGPSIEAAGRVAVGYDFLHDPLRMLFIWQGGLVMYGGLFGAILFGLWSSKKHGLALWNALDTVAAPSFVGLAVGRWGCLLVGDDHGKRVSEAWSHLPFPITVQVPSAEWLAANPQSLFPRDLAQQTLWCTQVWMSVNALLVALVAYLVLRRRRWVGQAAAVALVHYSITRFGIEMFRGDEIRGVWFDGALSTSQLVSVFSLLLGLALLIKRPGPAVVPASPSVAT